MQGLGRKPQSKILWRFKEYEESFFFEEKTLKIQSVLSSLQREGPPGEGDGLKQLGSSWLGRRELVQSLHEWKLCSLAKHGSWKRSKSKYGQHWPSLVEKVNTPTGFQHTWDSGGQGGSLNRVLWEAQGWSSLSSPLAGLVSCQEPEPLWWAGSQETTGPGSKPLHPSCTESSCASWTMTENLPSHLDNPAAVFHIS